MEVLLNILWFALCNLTGLCWLQRWRRNGRPRGGALQLSALVCVLVLLFPVISATDDLYAAQFAFETSVTQKSSKGPLGRFSTPQFGHYLHPAALTRTTSLSPALCVGLMAVDRPLPDCRASQSRPAQDRAPPSLPLF